MLEKTVVYGATRNLYQYVPMAIHSLLETNPDTKVYLICEDDSIDTITDERVHLININNIEQYIDKDNPNSETHFTYMSFVRCFLTKILEEERILWLDVDTLVYGNIDELFEMDMTRKAVAGVMEPRNLQLDNVYRPYINSGVLVMNLEYLRKYKLDDKILEIINTRKLTYPDQDAINHVCLGQVIYLDPKYNSSPSTYNVKNPVIRHFTYKKLWDDINVKAWLKYYVERI